MLLWAPQAPGPQRSDSLRKRQGKVSPGLQGPMFTKQQPSKGQFRCWQALCSAFSRPLSVSWKCEGCGLRALGNREADKVSPWVLQQSSLFSTASYTWDGTRRALLHSDADDSEGPLNHQRKIKRRSVKPELLISNWNLLKSCIWDFPGGAVVKNLPANAGDTGSTPGPGRSHMPRNN